MCVGGGLSRGVGREGRGVIMIDGRTLVAQPVQTVVLNVEKEDDCGDEEGVQELVPERHRAVALQADKNSSRIIMKVADGSERKG